MAKKCTVTAQTAHCTVFEYDGKEVMITPAAEGAAVGKEVLVEEKNGGYVFAEAEKSDAKKK